MPRHHIVGPRVLLFLLLAGCRDSAGTFGSGSWQGDITTSGDTTFVHTESGSVLGDLGSISADSLEVVYAGEGVLQSTVLAAAGERLLIGEGTQLVVVDGAGAFDSIGREGEGPGEFRRILDARFLGDTIEALDQNANRLTRIPPGGPLTLLTVEAPAGFAGLRAARLSSCRGATSIVWARGFVASNGLPDTVAVVWWTPGAPPTAWWLVTDLTWVSTGRVFGPRYPFGPHALIASDGDCRVASSDGVAYSIAVRTSGADTVQVISADEPDVAVGADAKTIPGRWRGEWPASSLPTVLGVIEAQDFGTTRNQLDELQFDDRDRLWVRVVDSTYQYHPWVLARVAEARPATYRWDVIGADGRRLALVHLPSAFNPKAWSGRWVYGIFEDADGVMVVGRLPLPGALR